MKAMTFMFVPTLGLLAVLGIIFMDLTAMFNWILSNDPLAVVVRTIITIVEVAVVYILYKKYDAESEDTRDIIVNTPQGKKYNYLKSCDVRDLFINGYYKDEYTIHTTNDPNTVIIERTPASKVN